jgi:hypothetical protein
MDDLEKGKYKYTPKEDKIIDFSAYSEAQIDEINNILILIRNITEEAAAVLHKQHGNASGRPQEISVVDLARQFSLSSISVHRIELHLV